jgi:hypothetical protein
MLFSANTVMNSDLTILMDDIGKKDKQLVDQNSELTHLNSKLVEYEK